MVQHQRHESFVSKTQRGPRRRFVRPRQVGATILCGVQPLGVVFRKMVVPRRAVVNVGSNASSTACINLFAREVSPGAEPGCTGPRSESSRSIRACPSRTRRSSPPLRRRAYWRMPLRRSRCRSPPHTHCYGGRGESSFVLGGAASRSGCAQTPNFFERSAVGKCRSASLHRKASVEQSHAQTFDQRST